MSPTDKAPITRGDLPEAEDHKQSVQGAHGDTDDREQSGSLGVSRTRKAPKDIAPTADIADD